MWLQPVLLVPEFSKFEKSNVKFSKEERNSSKYREFRKIEHSKVVVVVVSLYLKRVKHIIVYTY